MFENKSQNFQKWKAVEDKRMGSHVQTLAVFGFRFSESGQHNLENFIVKFFLRNLDMSELP